jgi:hypothetical protein
MMGVPFNPTFCALALAIVGASGLGLWWLLRREGATTLLALAAVTALALALRLAYTTDYPRGLNEDEPKVLYAAGRAVQRGTLLAESNISVPILMHALFQGQLIPLLGPGRWAIRGYSLVGGVLCIPAAFAAARALQLAVAPGLAVAGLIAVLPWAMFYSRVMQGAELTFQQLLLLAALGRLIFASSADQTVNNSPRPAGWREWALYGYWCTRAMLAMPLVAAVLASGRRRLWCLAVLIVGLSLYAPYVVANRNSMFIAQGVSPAYYASFGELARLGQRGIEALATFVRPSAEDGWLTVRAGALHPLLLLVVAACGVLLAGVRRGLFVLGGFVAGLAPTILAWGPPSTHRMLMAFPFVALAAGAALQRAMIWPRLAALASAALVAAVGWTSVRLYFSDQFWATETRWKFDWPRTELVESLPTSPEATVIFMYQITFFRDPRLLVTAHDQTLSVENWFPDSKGATYAFTIEGLALRPFYENLVGAGRIESFGGTFMVTLEPRDWSWMRQHGWAYAARCGDQTVRGQVLTLFHSALTFASFACDKAAQHTWHGRWNGPTTSIRLRAANAVVDAGTTHLEIEPGKDELEFTAEPDMEIRITVTAGAFQPGVYAALFEITPAGDRVPMWERVDPLFDAPTS